MQWDTRANGDIMLCPLMGYDTALLAGAACGLRVIFARDEAALRTGGEVVQLALSPKIALELSDSLRRMAELALQPTRDKPN